MRDAQQAAAAHGGERLQTCVPQAAPMQPASTANRRRCSQGNPHLASAHARQQHTEKPQCSTRSSLVEPGGHGVLSGVLCCEVVVINHVHDLLVVLYTEPAVVERAQSVQHTDAYWGGVAAAAAAAAGRLHNWTQAEHAAAAAQPTCASQKLCARVSSVRIWRSTAGFIVSLAAAYVSFRLASSVEKRPDHSQVP